MAPTSSSADGTCGAGADADANGEFSPAAMLGAAAGCGGDSSGKGGNLCAVEELGSPLASLVGFCSAGGCTGVGVRLDADRPNGKMSRNTYSVPPMLTTMTSAATIAARPPTPVALFCRPGDRFCRADPAGVQDAI